MPRALTGQGRRPPTKKASRQYDLFTQFFGDASDLSNTIELWDAIPKYSVSARIQSGLRDDKGRLPMHEKTFSYKPQQGRADALQCYVTIQPALIKGPDGQYQDYYPSVDEELIEEVLKKIFTDQQFGLHEAQSFESWVKFNLHMVYTELKARGKTRSLDEIKHSLEIMSKTIVEVHISSDKKGKAIYTGPILMDLTRRTREDYQFDAKSMWYARLPALISKSINELSYRQFNYSVLMSLSTPLARWLHKRLSHQYTNAGLMHPYKIKLSTIEHDSGLLNHSRSSVNRGTVSKAYEELIKQEVIISYVCEERRQGRKIEDLLYTLVPNPKFVQEIKAANARQRDQRQALMQKL